MQGRVSGEATVSGGQHVGAVSDSFKGAEGSDDIRSAARAKQEALRKLAKPIERARSRHDYGDGDRCPINPSHGKMFVLGGVTGRTQWCAHSAHEGTLGDDGTPRTRAFWPVGRDSFAAAVAGEERA